MMQLASTSSLGWLVPMAAVTVFVFIRAGGVQWAYRRYVKPWRDVRAWEKEHQRLADASTRNHRTSAAQVDDVEDHVDHNGPVPW